MGDAGPGGAFREGGQLGRYRLVARLGTGGMAEVFLGRIEGPAGFTKTVAIKRMRPELTMNREFVDLFVEEARTAAMLAHPNICHIHELTHVDGQYFMVMEYLEGVPVSSVLIRVLRRPTLFDVPVYAGILEQACEGLHHAHEMADEQGAPLGIIHRDVSPPNLFITTGGVVKVLDFGISKSRNSLVRTLTGQIRGKFSYMSPEQLRGETLDRRSDVFSLGIVLFELVTARRLFRRRSRLHVFQAIVKEPIPSAKDYRPDLPDELCRVIDRALARDREERFRTARELGQALAQATEPYGGASATAELGRLIQEHFSAELESKRQLHTGGGEEAPEPPAHAQPPTRPTANHRLPTPETRPGTAPPPDLTVPEAPRHRAPSHPDFVDTTATTHALSSHDATEVDLEAAPPPPYELDDDEPIPPPTK